MVGGDCALHFYAWREGILPTPVADTVYRDIDSKWHFAHCLQHESSVQLRLCGYNYTEEYSAV